MDKLNLRTIQDGPLRIEVYRVYDKHSRPDSLTDPDRYAGVEAAERKRYETDDADRLRAWEADEWHYIGVCCDIRIQTAANWAELPIIGRASIWGVESDSGADYFAQLEAEMIAYARADVELLRAALATVPQPVRA